MTYDAFAAYYDALNTEADYDRLAAEVLERLGRQGIRDGIVADLGCGTGELCLRLWDAGYDMIGVDRSAEMLSVLREKLTRRGKRAGEVLLLNQALEELDLYGTVRAMVCCFDTLNHLPPKLLKLAVRRMALFLEPGGLVVADINTPYKHQVVLASNVFEIETDDGSLQCRWENRYDPAAGRVEIMVRVLRKERLLAAEDFFEYDCEPKQLCGLMEDCGLRVAECLDGEDFGALRPTSQRALVVGVKPMERDDLTI